jgi:hypothetical protein
MRKCNYRDHLLSKKHASTKAVVEAQTMSVKVDDSIKPVMLLEVMEMFLTHQKHQQTEMSEILKTFADRIVATQPIQTLQNNIISAGNSNVVTNNHQKFNLNVFLNEECKNAMNFSDFLKTLSVTMEDIEHLGEVGYTQGMSKILTKAMSETNVRPMHCTDTKRETMYVKENDEWRKDFDCEESERLIKHIQQKNYKALKEWREHHPQHDVHDTEDHETWYRISRNMCNTDQSAFKKLIRHLAMVTAVEKGETRPPI